MKIVIAGMPRSASTRLYNIIRLILMQHYKLEEINCGWIDNFFVNEKIKVNMVKMHYFDKKWCDWSDFIFTTRRDLRSLIASSIDFRKNIKSFGLDLIHKDLQVVVNIHEKWYNHTNYELVYEDWDHNPSKIIEIICQILNLKCNVKEVLHGVEEIKNSMKEFSGKFDWHTLMNKNHISENSSLHYSERLPPEYINAIEVNCEFWLRKYGYII